MVHQEEKEVFTVDRGACVSANSIDPVEMNRQASIELDILRDDLSQMSLELDSYKRELSQANRIRRQYSELFDNAPIGYLIVDQVCRIIKMNSIAAELLDIDEADISNTLFSLCVSIEDREALKNKIKLVSSGVRVEFNVQIVSDNQHKKLATLFMQPVKDRGRNQYHCQVAILDISGRCAAEKQLIKARDYLQHLATHDELTGLPNRRSFNDSLANLIVSARRGGFKLAVVMLDLNKFKAINDTLGHDMGDELLLVTAKRVLNSIAAGEFVARLAGDEFVLVLKNFKNLIGLEAICEQIKNAISQPHTLSTGTEIRTSASIGISVYPTDGAEPEKLVQCADAAMYHAKATGAACVKFFTQGMGRAQQQKFRLEQDLRASVVDENFETWFQPIYQCSSNSYSSVEVLTRWRPPQRGLMQPARFIPLAEECGAIESLGFLILKKAFRLQHHLSLSGFGSVSVSINITPQQFIAPGFVDTVKVLLEQHHADAQKIEFEITENALFDESEDINAKIRRLQALGIRFAIDDFGTGYSSFSRLAKLQIRKFKIDQTFIEGIPNNKENLAIIKALITMGKDLGICIVAEGVETREQFDYLHSAGCDEIQGFLVADPMPSNNLLSLLKSGNAGIQQMI